MISLSRDTEGKGSWNLEYLYDSFHIRSFLPYVYSKDGELKLGNRPNKNWGINKKYEI
jgi:hypothetical protein